jgi:uncharacterized membrane protein (UPF0127 family)
MYVTAHISNFEFKTKVLKTPNETRLGMMGKRFNGAFDALLFVMTRAESTFWMKNCIVPLDVVFINKGIITKIHHNCPPCTATTTAKECISYPGVGNLVMELPGGECKRLRIRAGARVRFTTR